MDIQLTNDLELRLKNLSLPFGLSVLDLGFGAGLQTVEGKQGRAKNNIFSQCVSAAFTGALVTGHGARTIILCLGDGRAKGVENLIDHPHLAQSVALDFICKFRLARPEVTQYETEEIYIAWVDDPDAEDHPSVEKRFKRWGFRRFPLLEDHFVQKKIAKKNSVLRKKLPGFVIGGGADRKSIAKLNDELPENGWGIKTPGKHGDTIVFFVYWFDFGGAEAFAIQCMAAAKKAGFNVVVIADQIGRNRLIDRLDGVADAVYQIGVFGGSHNPHKVLTDVVRIHEPKIIHIHHSWTAYRMLPTWRILWPEIRIIDTTHILEHRHGGFVAESLRYSKFIDCHHVISADLKTLYDDFSFGGAKQNLLGRLHDLAQNFESGPGKWGSSSPFKVVFIGRFAAQKRPFLFVEIVRRLSRAFGKEKLTFSALGAGELLPITKSKASEYGVLERIEFLPGDYSVREFLKDANVLVICSENEGLTLISYEAISADCLVISADVGGQREITLPEFLIPKNPYAFVSGSVDVIKKIIARKIDAKALAAKQTELMKNIQRQKSGLDICIDFYSGV